MSALLHPWGRRRFLAGALMVSFASAGAALAQNGRLPSSLVRTPFLDAWIRIGEDGRITVCTGKAELGQGLRTALIQVAAHELAAPVTSITLVTADTARTPDEGVTSGSQSMSESGTAILNACANVRALLAEAAAWQFAVGVHRVSLLDGAAHAPDGRSVGYGALASSLSLHVVAKPDMPRLEGGTRVIGQSLPRVDIPAKVNGGEAYLQDLRLPGMLHARVVRGPSDGTRSRPGDVAAVEKLPGVIKVVREGSFTAVIADQEWRAVKALHRLQAAGWERTAPQIEQDLRETIRKLPAVDMPIFDYPGPPAPPDARIVRARYSRSHLMHGSIGPSCAVALWENDSLTVWTHSQGVYPLRRSLAELLRLEPGKVHCIHVEGAGCYGHNGADDVAADAALAARAVSGRPVRLQWMREQEHGWEPLGSAMVVELAAELDAQNRIVGWRHDVWSNTHSTRPEGAGGLLAGAEVEPPFAAPRPRPIQMQAGGGARNGNPIYALPNARGVFHFVEQMPARVSALRGLGAHMNVFAIESFMDELAAAAGADPVAFRLAWLRDERARDAVVLTADRFGWNRRKTGDGMGSGFAFARYKNLTSYCAVAFEVQVDRDSGEIQVPRVVAAIDAGEAVNPDGLRNQIEGGIVQSLSWTTLEAVGFDKTHRTSFDWSAYPILRFPAVPGRVEVHVIDRPGQPFLGAGEAAQGPAAAALANAVAQALGVRVRDMPLSAERLRAALKPAPVAPRQASG